MNTRTKKGNSNERIADAIFERIGFTTKVLREEDYGIDYLCSVGRETENSIYPTKTFVTQLKSNFDTISYDLTKKEKNKWLIDNNLPLFFCVYIEKTGLLYFYSGSMINDLIIRNNTEIEKLSFKFRQPTEDPCIVPIISPIIDGQKEYIIDCGSPFLKISVLETNDDNKVEFDNYRNILENVIKKENENIVYRNLNLPFMAWLHNYKENDANITFGWADYSDDGLVSSETLLDNLSQIIMTLCKTYYHEGKTNEYEHLKQIVDTIKMNEKNKTALTNLGFRDEKGNIIQN